MTAITILLLALLDIVAAWITPDSPPAVNEAVVGGLVLGQLGCLAAWVFAKDVRYRWHRVLTAYAGAVVGGCFLVKLFPGPLNWSEVALVSTILFAVVTISLALVIAYHWGRIYIVHRHTTRQPQWVPRFGVIHLLGLMLLLAIAATVFRQAIPELPNYNLPAIVGTTLYNAILVLFAAELFVGRLPSWWRLGLFSGFGLLLAAVLHAFHPSETFIYSGAVQLTVLAFGTMVPSLDQYMPPAELQSDQS